MLASYALTPSTRRRINWRMIEAAAIGIRSRAPSSQGPSEAQLQNVFAAAQMVFDAAIDASATSMRRLSWLAGVAFIAIAAGLGAMLWFPQVADTAAALVALSGMGGSLTIVQRLAATERDLALLRLVPTKYALALQLADSDERRSLLFDEFMTDLRRLQAPPPPRTWVRPSRRSRALADLATFLTTTMSLNELQRFTSTYYSELGADVRWATLNDAAHDLVQRLERQGRIRSDLFDHLVEVRGDRADEISVLRERMAPDPQTHT